MVRIAERRIKLNYEIRKISPSLISFLDRDYRDRNLQTGQEISSLLQEGAHFRRHAQVPERRVRSGARLRKRAGQLPEGQECRDVPHQAARAPPIQTQALVETEGLVGGRRRQQEQEELQDEQFARGERSERPERPELHRRGRRHRGRVDAGNPIRERELYNS